MQTETTQTPVANLARTSSDSGRVLIVDDDPINRTILRKPLEAEGYVVVEADGARQAVHRMTETLPDVILLDIMMPGMNGFEACRLFKRNNLTASIPILRVTALGEREQRLRGIEMGANDFLTKPVDARDLALRVKNAVQTKRLFDQVQAERRRADALLHNILPRPIAERMKNGERDIADHYPEAAILVARITGLTELVSHVSPKQVVYLLTELVSSFDALTEARGLEKIKAFGNEYMAAGGLSMSQRNYVEAAAELALEMVEEVRQFNAQYKTRVSLRIGISAGPVIAGVLGRKNFAFDLWGTAVNEALRLQAQCPVAGIRVGSETYQRLADKFAFKDQVDQPPPSDEASHSLVGLRDCKSQPVG